MSPLWRRGRPCGGRTAVLCLPALTDNTRCWSSARSPRRRSRWGPMTHGMRPWSRVHARHGFQPIADDVPLRDPLETAIPHAGHGDIQALGQHPNRDTMPTHEPAQIAAAERPRGRDLATRCHGHTSCSVSRWWSRISRRSGGITRGHVHSPRHARRSQLRGTCTSSTTTSDRVTRWRCIVWVMAHGVRSGVCTHTSGCLPVAHAGSSPCARMRGRDCRSVACRYVVPIARPS